MGSSEQFSDSSNDFSSAPRAASKEIFELILKKKTVIISVVVFALVMTTLIHFMFPTYSARGYLFVDSTQEQSGVQALLSTLGSQDSILQVNQSEGRKFLLVLNSNQFLRRVAETILQAPDTSEYKPLIDQQGGVVGFLSRTASSVLFRDRKLPSEDPIKFAQLLRVQVRPIINKDGIIDVIFRSSDENLTRFIANHYLSVAREEFSNNESKKLTTAREYIDAKIDETIDKMQKTDGKMVDLNTKSSNLSLLAPPTVIAEQLLSWKEEIQRTKHLIKQNLAFMEQLKAKNTSADVSSPDEVGFGRTRTIKDLEVKNKLLNIRLESLNDGLKELVKSNSALPKQEQELTDLKRQKGLEFYVFDNLYKTKLQIEVRGLSLLNKVYPLENISPEDVVVGTKLFPKLILTLFLSLVGVSSVIYGINLFNPVVRSKKDFTDLHVSPIGLIPAISADYFAGTPSDSLKRCRFQVDSKETIAFKRIRSRLIYLSEHSGSNRRQTVSLLSYGNGEGKSFLSSNLALCFAHTQKKTLLVDFDIRRASSSKAFGLEEAPGLCDYFNGHGELNALIVTGKQRNLDILPAGKIVGNTIDKISNTKVSALLNDLRSLYDFIIVDTAPLLVAPESLIVAKESDFAVLAATAWSTRKDDVKDAIEEIRSVRSSHIHYLLNKTEDVRDHLVNNYYYMDNLKGQANENKKKYLSRRLSPKGEGPAHV